MPSIYPLWKNSGEHNSAKQKQTKKQNKIQQEIQEQEKKQAKCVVPSK